MVRFQFSVSRGDDGNRTHDKSFADSCLTTWRRRHVVSIILLTRRAGNETRTRDLLLGKEVFYQLNYARIMKCSIFVTP